MRYLLILLLFASCAAPRPLKDKAKASRLVSKIERLDPSALTSTTDTIFSFIVLDTVIFSESIRIDTLVKYTPGDTVVIRDSSGVVTRLVIHRDTVRVFIEVPPLPVALVDSFSVATKVVNTIELRKNKWAEWGLSIWRYVAFLGVVLVLALIVRWVVKR
jgi:hypothetical protein